jgi:hypothetical protein
MLWPLDCFVARAPRNDGRVAADPIDSVVIGRLNWGRIKPDLKLAVAYFDTYSPELARSTASIRNLPYVLRFGPRPFDPLNEIEAFSISNIV